MYRKDEVVPAKHPGGRPLKYKTSAEMQEEIDLYFQECRDGIQMVNEFGDPIYNKDGSPAMAGQKPPTVTGLALALGFTSRTDLLRYEAKDEFYSTIQKAKSRIEEYAEIRLFDRDGVQGAKFSLANNFAGWREQQDINVNTGAVQQAGEYQTLRELKEEREKQSKAQEIVDIQPVEESDEP